MMEWCSIEQFKCSRMGTDKTTGNYEISGFENLAKLGEITDSIEPFKTLQNRLFRG